uniref:Cystatin B (Stefin B) n=2 Tax=Callorhinchus milii TaxID=7868 RepID=V9LHE2_CALMI
MVGGMGTEAMSATEEVQQIADSLKIEIETKAGKQFSVFVVKSFKTQIVAGVNYFMKIHVGNDEYLHARVYKSLPPGKISLHDLLMQKTAVDEICYF